jgi:hypothetical protein
MGRKNGTLMPFIAAILLYTEGEQTNAHKLLVELGCDLIALRASFLSSLLRWGVDDNAAWQCLLDPSVAAPPSAAPAAPAAQPNWGLPRIVNDRVSGRIAPDRDHLDASRPALRFAKLLSARDVEPPIALGLFGNWGTGKSFFMGLMQSHIDALTDGNDPAYVRKAAQIDFNAWHYQDTNLWASLALRIFEGLAAKLAPKDAKPTQLEKTKKKLNQSMASSTQRKAEASAQRSAARERRQKQSKLLEAQMAAREQTACRQLENAWTVVQTKQWFPRALSDLRNSSTPSEKRHTGPGTSSSKASSTKMTFPRSCARRTSDYSRTCRACRPPFRAILPIIVAGSSASLATPSTCRAR